MLASAAFLAAVDNARDQKRNNKDGADDDSGFDGLGLALEPPFQLYRKTKNGGLVVTKITNISFPNKPLLANHYKFHSSPFHHC